MSALTPDAEESPPDQCGFEGCKNQATMWFREKGKGKEEGHAHSLCGKCLLKWYKKAGWLFANGVMQDSTYSESLVEYIHRQ